MNNIDKLKEEILEKLKQINDLKALNELRTIYFCKKGPVNELTSKLSELTIDEKKRIWNEIKSI